MDCQRYKEWFFPYLDGELNEHSCRLFLEHVRQCGSCQEELEAWQALSGYVQVLQAGTLSAPPHFAAGVMAQIKADQTNHRQEKFKHWQKVALGTAAAALLALGTYLFPSSTQLAEKDPVDFTSQPANVYTVPDTSGIDRVEDMIIDNSDTVAATQPEQNSPVQKPGATAPGNEAVTPPVEQNPAPSTDPDKYPAVLTNTNHQLVSTMLLIDTNDIDEAEKKAGYLAANANASFQPLGRQEDGNTGKSSYKISVPYEKADQLIAQLNALGTVVSRQTDRQDNDYDHKWQQLLDLQNQAAAAEDAAKRKQLDEQINKLNQQLLDWNTQCEKQTIVLWLQKS